MPHCTSYLKTKIFQKIEIEIPCSTTSFSEKLEICPKMLREDRLKVNRSIKLSCKVNVEILSIYLYCQFLKDLMDLSIFQEKIYL